MDGDMELSPTAQTSRIGEADFMLGRIPPPHCKVTGVTIAEILARLAPRQTAVQKGQPWASDQRTKIAVD